MLGFGKKKKKGKDDKDESEPSQKGAPEKPEKSDKLEKPEKKKGKDKPEAPEESGKKDPEKKKRKWPSKKMLFMLLLVLIAVGASSYLVYYMYFTPKDPGVQKATYKKIVLAHTNLPEEMLRFSFDYFPDLYVLFISFNHQMDLIDREIARIEAVAQKYPDQAKIAEKEKNVWEKAKNALQKSFLKIEAPVKDTYVLFQVNREQGLAQIDAKKAELAELAKTALEPAQELTQKINSQGETPQGFIKGTIYKLKKKFL